MKPSEDQLVIIDNDVRSMQKFIGKCGQEPAAPDIQDNAYTLKKFGNLGEQYVQCLFNEANIKKIKRGSTPKPDFKLFLNGKPFLSEVKTVSNLYTSFLLLLDDLIQNHDWNQLSKTVEELLRCYDFSINPIEIHREDKVEFKEILKIKLEDLKLPFKKTSFIIRCTCRNYTIRIHRKTNERQDVFSLFTGFAPNETKSLSTIVSKKKRQLGSSDIWIIILLNRSIAPIDLLNFFYRPIELPMPLKQSLNEISEKSTFPSILQYEYSKTPWGVTFKDGQGHQHTIGEQLKCSIVIYPFSRSSFIFPAIKHFDSFSTPEYWNLKTILEAQGFRCNCALQSITFKQVSP